MQRISALLFLLVFCFATAMQAQAPKPDPEMKKLGVLVGHWTYEGEYKPGPLGPGSKIVGAGEKEHQFCRFGEQQPRRRGRGQNSIVVSKFSAILAFYFRVSANRCSVRVPGGNCLRLWPCQVRLA